MRFVQVLFIGCVAVGAYSYVKSHHKPADVVAEKPVAALPAPIPESPHGFIALPPLADSDPGTVYIFAPVNCPHAAAQRADELNRMLSMAGIPAARTANAQFPVTNPADAERYKERLDKVMLGELPIVIINGRAKNNPDLADTEAEYRSRDRY